MNNAKSEFIERFNTFSNILGSNNPLLPFLTDKHLNEIEHNKQARLLRNGLAVSLFNTLEDYIKKRIGESIQSLSNTQVPFYSYPESFQRAVTIEALESINKIAVLKQKQNDSPIRFVQEECLHIASTVNTTYSLSAYSLGWTKSNIDASDVATFMKIHGVNNLWKTINFLSNQTGTSISDSGQFFLNISQARHKAAHEPHANISISDLNTHLDFLIAFAFSIDILLKKCLYFYSNNTSSFITPASNRGYDFISHIWKIRYLVKHQDHFKEYKSINKIKAIKIHTHDYSEAIIRAQRNDAILIIQNENQKIIDWHAD